MFITQYIPLIAYGKSKLSKPGKQISFGRAHDDMF